MDIYKNIITCFYCIPDRVKISSVVYSIEINFSSFYIHDLMCGWCYAFGQNWIALQQEVLRDVEIVCLLGGLASDATEPMPLAAQKMAQQARLRTLNKLFSVLTSIGISGRAIHRRVLLIRLAVRI